MPDEPQQRGQPGRAAGRAAAPAEALPALTGLRAIAALAVLLAHGAGLILKFQASSIGWVYWLEQGAGFGMTLFFVLSGFVIHYNYRTIVTANKIAGIGWFIWARFARLYPLFFLMLIIDILFGHNFYKYMAGEPNEFSDIVRALPYYLTFTQSWVYLPLERYSLIYAIGVATPLTWSISTEWFFYLCYPFFAGLLLKLRRPGTTILFMLLCAAVWVGFAVGFVRGETLLNKWAVIHFGEMAGVVDGQASTLQDSFRRWLIYFSPYARIGEFVLGCLTCQLYLLMQGREVGSGERVLGRILTWAAVASLPVATHLLYRPQGGYSTVPDLVLAALSNNFGLAPTAALMIFCMARYSGVLARLLGSAPMVGIGEASYSIYLLHFPILAMIGSYVAYELPMTAANIAFQLARLGLLMAVIVGLALAVSTYIEAPSRRWMRRLWSSNVEVARWKEAVSVLSIPGFAAAVILLAVPSGATTPGPEAGHAIRVVEATYGRNCGARVGNATADARKACNGADSCDYVVDVDRLGDPANGCGKDFRLEYVCLPQTELIRKTLPGEAGLRSRLRLDCPTNGQSAATNLR